MTPEDPSPRGTLPRTLRLGLRGRGAFARRSVGRSVAMTAALNVTAAVTAGIAGAIIARALGPSARGDYASVMVWFGVLLAVGQLGQTSAITYFVARHPGEGAEYLATSRNLMVATGTITLTAGMLVAPVLAQDNSELVLAFRLMFGTCLVSFLGASYTFALQATRIALWNLVRVSQALAFVAVIAILALVQNLSLMTAIATLSATITAQAALAMWLCGRRGLTGGRGRIDLARPMTRYGLGQLAATVPELLSNRLDQLVLSFAVAPGTFGNYAVAASLTGLATPIVAAVGNVAFPRLASLVLSPARATQLQQQSIVVSAVIATTLMLALAGAAGWLVPTIFGSDFRDAVPLIWLMAPGGVFVACAQVCRDLLFGRGRPLAVARAQVYSAAAMAVLLALLLPPLGVAGAALASSLAPALAVGLMIGALRRLSRLPDRAHPAHSDPPA